MKVANLIITYTNPRLTERMIKRLGDAHFDHYIHVDKKKDIEQYRHLAQYPNVFFVKERIDVRWAGYNTTKAIFSCIQEVLNSGKQYDYLNLLSGQDYPLKSSGYMLSFLEQHKGKQFIEFLDITTEWTEAAMRLKKYYLGNLSFKGKHFAQKIINAVLPYRKIPYNLKPYGKGMFWTLTPDCAAYVLNKIKTDRKLLNFFAYTWAGEEIMFQTLLCSSPYKDQLVNDDYRYIDWSGGGLHPKSLNIEDFEKLKSSADLFGRKFTADGEGEIFDRLDEL